MTNARGRDGAVARAVAPVLDCRADALRVVPVSGGSIHQAFRVDGRAGRVFVKWNDARAAACFEAEAQGLDALREAPGLRVPRVLARGRTDTRHGWSSSGSICGHCRIAVSADWGARLPACIAFTALDSDGRRTTGWARPGNGTGGTRHGLSSGATVAFCLRCTLRSSAARVVR